MQGEISPVSEAVHENVMYAPIWANIADMLGHTLYSHVDT